MHKTLGLIQGLDIFSTMRYNFISTSEHVKGMEKLERSDTAAGDVTEEAPVENSLAAPQRVQQSQHSGSCL
jgi:hypothetical protein